MKVICTVSKLLSAAPYAHTQCTEHAT